VTCAGVGFGSDLESPPCTADLQVESEHTLGRLAAPPTENRDVVVVAIAPGVALAEGQLLLRGQAVDGSTRDGSGGVGIAGIVEVGAAEAGLDGAPILGETKWMQIDSSAKGVLEFDPDRKPVLSRHKGESSQKLQEFVQLVGIDGEVKIMMGTCLTSEQGVDRPAACDAGSHAVGR
jgi:hypothetical protein